MPCHLTQPGTWESGGDIALYSTTNYLSAISELIAHYGNRPTFVLGHSMGGTMAMHTAVTNPAVVALAALMSDPSFVPDASDTERLAKWEASGSKRSYRDLPGNRQATRQFKLPYAFSEDARQYSAVNGLQTLVTPKLFVAGKQDTLITPEVVKLCYELSAEPKSFATLDTGHDYRRDEAAIRAANVLLDNFLSGLAAS